EALGWGLVPLTVPREGPLGDGSLQLFVDADFEQHYLTLLERGEHRDQLQQICLFDLLSNNADRKSGHCLLGPDGRIYAIDNCLPAPAARTYARDNGLTFHVAPKLRTVIGDFAGEPIPSRLLRAIERLLDGGIPDELAELITADEQRVLRARGKALARTKRFP